MNRRVKPRNIISATISLVLFLSLIIIPAYAAETSMQLSYDRGFVTFAVNDQNMVMDYSLGYGMVDAYSGYAMAGDLVFLHVFTDERFILGEWSVKTGSINIYGQTSETIETPYGAIKEYIAWFEMPDPAINIDIVAIMQPATGQQTAPPTVPQDPAIQPAEDIIVLVNEVPLELDVPPYLIDGRTMVPLRVIFEAFGVEVNWDPDEQTISATHLDLTINLMIGSNVLVRNGISSQIDVPPMIIGGRTLVPTRVIAESLGADVVWDAAARTVIITRP